MSPAATSEAEQAARIRASPRLRREAWKKGRLWWLLHPVQLAMYRQFYSTNLDLVWDCARRLGKSYLLLVLELECCLRKPRAQAKYAAPTGKDVRHIIRPLLEQILETCPPELQPKADWHLGDLVFPNGSLLAIAGCDNGNYRHLRGQGADIWATDEGGFIEELEKVVDDVLGPQTWTTGGRGIIASTPPESIGHPFRTRYLAAKAVGASARFTFWDNPLLSEERRQEIVSKEARQKRMTVEDFQKTTVFRREFLAEFVTEETRAVFPVLTEALAEELTREQDAFPLFADLYTVVDLGGTRDPTGIQCSYWDFARNKWVIRKDAILRRPTTEQIANAVRTLEEECFGRRSDSSLGGMRFRIIDDDMEIVTRDLACKHGLGFIKPEKDNKQAAAMDVCDMMFHKEFEFHPDASNTLAHCQAAIWDRVHREFERVDGFGHFELADCTIYGGRNVIRNKGRMPAEWGFNRETTHRSRTPDSDKAALRRAFGGF